MKQKKKKKMKAHNASNRAGALKNRENIYIYKYMSKKGEL